MLDPRALSLRSGAFLFLCILYGLFGSPTPPDFGVVEILIALSLVVTVSPVPALHAVFGTHRIAWQMAGQALFFYALSVPVIGGLIGGNDMALMIRDIIPFLFLLLPFFMMSWRGDARLAAAAVAFAGLAFAARVVAPVVLAQDAFIGVGKDPLYLSIAPTITFASIALIGTGGLLLYRRFSLKVLAGALMLAALGVVPLAAMVITLQRAGLGLSAAALGFLFVLAFIHRPTRCLGPIVLGLIVLLACAPAIGDISSSLLHKNALVGNNNRFAEASVVFESVGDSVWSVLFGRGWGTTLADPAVGGVVVNYTHNLFTTYFLKTGLCGLTLVIVYLFGLCARLWPLLWRYPVIAVALAVPVFIDMTLYASFKSLDFGLILLLLMLWGRDLQQAKA